MGEQKQLLFIRRSDVVLWWWKILLWCYVGASLWSRCRWMQPPLLLPLQHRYTTSLFEILWRRKGDGVIIFERGAWSSIIVANGKSRPMKSALSLSMSDFGDSCFIAFFVDSEWLVDRGIFADCKTGTTINFLSDARCDHEPGETWSHLFPPPFLFTL